MFERLYGIEKSYFERTKREYSPAKHGEDSRISLVRKGSLPRLGGARSIGYLDVGQSGATDGATGGTQLQVKFHDRD